jgi:mxaJ protein
MSSRFRRIAVSAALLVLVADNGPSATLGTPALRVCADPNNLPFSNARREGFENRIAELIAADLKMPVRYTWWAQRRGFIRNTLNEGVCDVIMGVPTSLDLLLTTAPYYRSTYVFVTRREGGTVVRSLDDPVLHQVTVGVQLIGDDGTNSPPAHALAKRGIVRNVRGYTVYGDYTTDSPPARIIDAVSSGDIDVAIAWGPMAGYWASRSKVPLALVPVTPAIELPFMPNVFDIGVGVRHRDTTRRALLEAALSRRRVDIDRILDAYHVPRLATARGVSP